VAQILKVGNVHMTLCACGYWLATGKGEAGYPLAVAEHQLTPKHRAWADGPAFGQWQNDRTMEGQDK